MSADAKDRPREPKPASANRARDARMNPGDQAPAGTPGTGENICPVCSGKGMVAGKPCENCGGSGKVVEGIGGA